MKLYFSGVASRSEAEMLKRAGVRDYLADLADADNVPALLDGTGAYALDSGAYRAWKSGDPLTLESWNEQLLDVTMGRSCWYPASLDFATMPDVLGDPIATWDRWQELATLQQRDDSWICGAARDAVPVWQWGAPMEHLEEMAGRRMVAIGGCVPWMRDKIQRNLDELVDICRTWGEREENGIAPFHILGLNWLAAMDALAPLVRSCDTSKWLDGARYGVVIQDEQGKLSALHKRHCPTGQDRESLCIASAQALDRAINHGIRTKPAIQGIRKVREYTLREPEKTVPRTSPSLALIHSLAESDKRREEAKERFLDELQHRK